VLAPARPANVLVVEDDHSLRELYRTALVSAGFRAVAAADGLNALALLDQTKVDVVVLDLGLPRVSGWDVYRDLRSRPYMAELPIIIVTGNDLRDIPPQELSSFLQKPVDPERLVAAVDQALGFV